jgi:hypothetical protein
MAGTNKSEMLDLHLKQWKHNRRFAQSIDSNYRDWQVTAAFYAALHLVNAALAYLNVEVSNHSDRNDRVKSNPAFSGMRDNFIDLYRICWVVRYDPDPDKWIPEQHLNAADLVEALLPPIEREIELIIKQKLDVSKVKMQR